MPREYWNRTAGSQTYRKHICCKSINVSDCHYIELKFGYFLPNSETTDDTIDVNQTRNICLQIQACKKLALIFCPIEVWARRRSMADVHFWKTIFVKENWNGLSKLLSVHEKDFSGSMHLNFYPPNVFHIISEDMWLSQTIDSRKTIL